MDEFFIQCVRQCPCLWDTKLPSYKQLDVKEAVWRGIVKKTNIESVAFAKSKWKNLRDTYREKLKKIKNSKSGHSRKSIKSWKYMSHMDFLLPHDMNNLEGVTNIAPTPDCSASVEESHCAEVSRDSDSIPIQKKKKDTIHDDDDALLKLIKETAQRDVLNKDALIPCDPLKTFFDSMYQSTKQMPEFHQRAIKRKLFNLVMEAEDNIANTNNPFTGYYSNENAYNTRPSTSQTNYSPEDAAHTPEQKHFTTDEQQSEFQEETATNNEIQDLKPVIPFTVSDYIINDS